MKSMATALMLTLVLALAGCVSVDKRVLVPGFAPIPEAEVTVYLPGDPVPAHIRVAVLEAQYQSHNNDLAEMLDKLRSEAAKLGANGVVIPDAEAEGQTSHTAGMLIMDDVDFGNRVTTQAYAIRVEG